MNIHQLHACFVRNKNKEIGLASAEKIFCNRHSFSFLLEKKDEICMAL